MRSCLVMSVLALLAVDYVHLAPQHITLLRNSSLDGSDLEVPGFESERNQGTLATNDDDKTELSTLEDQNAVSNSNEYDPTTNENDYTVSRNSELSASTIGGSSLMPNHSSELNENVSTATEGSTTGTQKHESFSVALPTGESRESNSSDDKIKEIDVLSISHDEDVTENDENAKTGVKEDIDSEYSSTALPHHSELSVSDALDSEVIKAYGSDYNDDENDDVSDDNIDTELKRSGELIEAKEREEDEYHSTSSSLKDKSPEGDTFSTNPDHLDESKINTEQDFHKNSEEITDAIPAISSTTTENPNKETALNTTTMAPTLDTENLKFRHEELEDLPTTSRATEEVHPSEVTTSDIKDHSEFHDINEKLTSDDSPFSDDVVGLHVDEDALKVTTSGQTTFGTKSNEDQPSAFPDNPSVSEYYEERSDSSSSSLSDTFINEELAEKQVLSEEVPKISDDVVSIMTTFNNDQSSLAPVSDSELESSSDATLRSSSGSSVSDDYPSTDFSTPIASSKLTSEGLNPLVDMSASLNSAGLISPEDELQSAKSTFESQVDDERSFPTVDDTLPHSSIDSDIGQAETNFPATDTTSTFETNKTNELKTADIPTGTSERLDTNTPSDGRTTTSRHPTTSVTELTSTTKEKTTTLVWHGPTVLPRQTTTVSSEFSSKLEETESVPSEEAGVEVKKDDKHLFESRFSDRYLSGDNLDMVAAVQFLHYHDKASSEQCFKLVDAHWNYATNLTEENKRKQLQQTLEYSLFHKDAWKNATSFAWKSFNDTLLRRWFKSLSILGNAALPEDKLTEFNQLKAEMKNTYSTAKVCPYIKPEDLNPSAVEKRKCNLSLEPDLQSILMKSRDYDELVHVWKEWRDAAGKPIREKFLRFMELSNEAATLNGFPDTGDMWREAYESDSFQQDLDLLWEQLRPLYEHLHAYVRRKLIHQYGSEKILEDGPIPAHLFGNMWAQSWVSLLDITQPFPGKPSVDVTSTMEAKNMTALDMFKVSEEFFTSLGLKAMPEEFWERSLIEKPKDREIICHASAWDFCNGRDYRIKQCTVITMEDLITVHHEMGHIQYFLQYARQPNVFREGANPGFHEAIGDVLALSVSTPKHLLSIGLLDEIADDPEGDLNFLLRTALEKVAFLPSGYLIDLWRWGLFNGEIKYEEMNSKWWELRLKYQGICPPVKRMEEDFDPGAKYHVAGNVPYIRYFVSYVIQFQFHKVLCDAAGHTGPLYKCDIYRSKEAGQILSQVMELGSSEHWSEAMRIMTGGAQTKMDAQPIMEYFEPLLNWLIEQNKNETLGWRSDDVTVCP